MKIPNGSRQDRRYLENVGQYLVFHLVKTMYFSKAYSQWVNHGTYFPMIFRWKFPVKVHPVPGGPCSRRCRKGVPFCCAFSKALVDHWRRSAKFSSWALHRDVMGFAIQNGGFAGDFLALKMACCPDLLWKMGFLGWFTQQQSWFHRIFMGFSWRWFIWFPDNWISWVIFMEESMGWWSMGDQWVLQWPQTWLTGTSSTNGHFISTYRRIPCQNRTFSGLGEKSSLEITGNHDFYSQI